MHAPDPVAPLRERVARLRNERDLAREELARMQLELERSRTARVAEARALARKKRLRLLASIVIASNALLLGGVGAYLWRVRVGEETLAGHVTSVTGPAPANIGEPCTARLGSEIGPFNARVVVDCGSQRLYGYDSFGAIRCESAAGRAASCSDPRPIGTDGDPSLLLDRRAGRMTLADGPRWQIVVALDRAR